MDHPSEFVQMRTRPAEFSFTKLLDRSVSRSGPRKRINRKISAPQRDSGDRALPAQAVQTAQGG